MRTFNMRTFNMNFRDKPSKHRVNFFPLDCSERLKPHRVCTDFL